MTMTMSYGVYLHIPFCKSKCGYCGFVSRPGNLELQQRYTYALEMELEQFSAKARTKPRADTVYLGGGTPSLLEADLLQFLLDCIRLHFHLEDRAEISMEANPGTISRKKAVLYRKLGINRISLGAQSFQDRELSALGRIHTADQITESAGILRRSGVDNLSLDLMLGLPGQTWDSWEDTLGRATELAPSHISVYMLELEKGTPLFKQVARGKCVLPDDDHVADWYLRSLDLLDCLGYRQYEISSFARSGFECRHNLKYWRKNPYLGFGVGSHSNEGPVRYSNYSNLAVYLRAIEHNRSPVARRSRLSRKDELAETLFLGLRLNEGVKKEALEEGFGTERCARALAVLRQAEQAGLVAQTGTHFCLTARGRLLSNEVFQHLVGS